MRAGTRGHTRRRAGGGGQVTSCFLYISHTWWYLMGKRTKRWGLGARMGSVDASVAGCSVRDMAAMGAGGLRGGEMALGWASVSAAWNWSG